MSYIPTLVGEIFQRWICKWIFQALHLSYHRVILMYLISAYDGFSSPAPIREYSPKPSSSNENSTHAIFNQ